MKKLLANLSVRQRITIAVVAALFAGGLYYFVDRQREADYKPLFNGVSAEDAAGIVQKLKETGVPYRLPLQGGSVLVPSARLAELRLAMAAVGLPKTGRIGFELFDKTNLGATEFTEQVNYRRALEGELERSIMSLTEVEQARVHLTFAKDSVFLDSRQPAKASVVVSIRPGARLAAQNIVAIDHLVASAVEGLSPDAVTVLDTNGNLLGRPKAPGGLGGPEPSEAGLDYRHKLEADLVAKINSTLEPLLGSNKFRAGVSVDCDFSGGEQSEETFDPTKSVMVSSQKTEDATGSAAAAGVPGTASTLPRPTSRPNSTGKTVTRSTENVTYQTSRLVKTMRLPAGSIRKISVAVLVDQELQWQQAKDTFQRVLLPPTPEKLKIIRDLVAGVTGFNTERGDQLVIETLPFESTLTLEPPPVPKPPAAPKPAPPMFGVKLPQDKKTWIIVGSAAGGLLLVLGGLIFVLSKRHKKKKRAAAEAAPAIAAGQPAAAALPGAPLEDQIESKLAERDALQHRLETQALNNLKLAPVITKTSEVLAKHLREKITKEPEVSAQILRTWIREEESDA
jgi:flagellar M-ring protein FliF